MPDAESPPVVGFRTKRPMLANHMDQTLYRPVIDAGHNKGTSLREAAGYDEKC
jgi:hypothetical protein